MWLKYFRDCRDKTALHLQLLALNYRLDWQRIIGGGPQTFWTLLRKDLLFPFGSLWQSCRWGLDILNRETRRNILICSSDFLSWGSPVWPFPKRKIRASLCPDFFQGFRDPHQTPAALIWRNYFSLYQTLPPNNAYNSSLLQYSALKVFQKDCPCIPCPVLTIWVLCSEIESFWS